MYGDTSNLAWYIANGLNISYHNGTDFVIGDSIQTYGTKLVCPFPQSYLSQKWWDIPMSSKGNGIQISWEEGTDRYNVRFWHCSEIVTKLSYKEGEVIGYIGNSGLVKPAPAPQSPFAGAHLHLMVYKNGVLIDPLEIFDKDQWFLSDDTGLEKDLPPFFWVVNFIKEQIEKIKRLLG